MNLKELDEAKRFYRNVSIKSWREQKMSKTCAPRAACAALLIAAAGAVSACAPLTSYSGYQAIEASPADMTVGVETKSTVKGKLGSPSATSTFDPNVWFYVNQVKQRVAFQRPQVVARQVVALSFDKESERLVSVEKFSLKDGKVIAFNRRETPTRGRELTVLEQLLGNVGRGSMLPQDGQGVPGNRPSDRR
jgi:outer membrane protein assembly factor BamE (lipoprotein component of BamABCDE complex)